MNNQPSSNLNFSALTKETITKFDFSAAEQAKYPEVIHRTAFRVFFPKTWQFVVTLLVFIFLILPVVGIIMVLGEGSPAMNWFGPFLLSFFVGPIIFAIIWVTRDNNLKLRVLRFCLDNGFKFETKNLYAQEMYGTDWSWIPLLNSDNVSASRGVKLLIFHIVWRILSACLPIVNINILLILNF